ncbi:MAG TPA: hypothetical protein VF649_13980 [Sphingomonas sp.]|jgi:hypothetical protein|uniref:hypothetical protein n=1 Tax=Sphingomonas sp. TaxID=28214 RepID=UPI002EDB08E7
MTPGVRRQRRGTGDWIQLMLAEARGVPPGYWVMSGLVVIGITLMRVATAGSAAMGADVVQALALILMTYVLYRAAVPVRPVVRIGPPLIRFGAAWIAAILFTLVPLAIARALLPAGARLADLWLWAFVATTIANLVLLPLAPWIAALAIGDRQIGPGGGWRLLRRQFGSFAGAYLAVVSPCFAVHLMLTMLLDDPASTLSGTALIAVVFVDSAASLAQLVLSVALGTAAWRLREGKPAR